MWRLAALCIGVCLSLPASAATLDAVEGQVLINRGEGFQPVAAATQAREGDLVMANPGGRAKLIYPGGCVTEIKPGNVTTVGDGSHCPQAMLVGEDGDWCRKHRDDDTQDRSEYRQRCGVVWWPYAVGVGAAAAITAGVLIFSNDDGDNDGGGKKDDDDGLNP